MAELGPANAIPHMLAPKELDSKENVQTESMEKRVEKLFQVLDLKGLESWPEDDQAKAKELIQEYQDIFALRDTELEHTKLIKHEIRLLDDKPFKERYLRIPP